MIKKQQGLSLIEVMVTLVILSFGLIGFIQGQLITLSVTEQAYNLNLANLKNNELVERLRSCDNNSPCIEEQLNLWKVEVKEILPKGQYFSTSNGRDYKSKITWLSANSRKVQSLYLLFQL